MEARANSHEDKRRLILDAAVRVFARRGYHACRVADIAAEARVAHGLLYHYFSSKEEVLQTVFRETWAALLDRVRRVEEAGEAAPEQLREVVAIVLGGWRNDPDLIRVLVREIVHGPQLGGEGAEVAEALAALERIVRRGQERSELRRDLDAGLAATVVYGALEEILKGWVLGHLPDGPDDVERAEAAVVAVVSDGLLARA